MSSVRWQKLAIARIYIQFTDEKTMTAFFSPRSINRLTRIISLGLLCLVMVVGLITMAPAQAKATVFAQVSPAETKKLANDVETAAENSFKGLDTTKKIIGKTKYRNDAIGYGRTKASQKLKALSEKLDASEGQIDRSLSPTEKLVVEQMRNRKSD